MPDVHSLQALWVAETIRLREAHWGPLDDDAEVRRARLQGRSFAEQIVLRAVFLGQREKIDLLVGKWRRGARLAFVALLFAALVAGFGAALGALGDGTHSVNLLMALVALLGLHCLTFVLWLLSFALSAQHGGVWLGEVWLWLTKKLARGPDAALVPRALIELLGRNNALRWVLASVSHAVWTAALSSLLLTLLAALSARRYTFNWETTLWSADTLVRITTTIGWLPAKFGFVMPDAAVIRASNGLQSLPESAHALWSSWLIGCVVVYGLAPRIAALALTLLAAANAVRDLQVDENLPVYARLRKRLQPRTESMGIDAADAAHPGGRPAPQPLTGRRPQQPAVVGIELPSTLGWPPAALPAAIGDLGRIDTGRERNALLDRLHEYPPRKLLLVYDSRQTPDRGVLALATAIVRLVPDTQVWLSPSRAEHGTPGARAAAWNTSLMATGFTSDQLHAHWADALAWLEQDETHA